ncbi:Uncharacterised protein [uncultured archaeon]|nr:Uncharacterised protein [uncultured archaeon]
MSHINDKIEELQKEYRNILQEQARLFREAAEAQREHKETMTAIDSLWARKYKAQTATDKIQDIDEQITEKRKELQKMPKANSKVSKFKKTADARKEDLKTKIKFLEPKRDTATRQPEICKSQNQLYDKPFYSIWIGTSPIFLYDGQNLHYLHTNSKNKTLEIRTTPLERILSKLTIKLSEELLGLKPNTFCDQNGYVLTNEQEEKAERIFEQVFTGVEILPDENSPAGYTVRNPRTPTGLELRPRHWGQAYLTQKTPERIILGKLLGSGRAYKAYVFGEKTIVESDEEARATYLFNTPHFENLRSWERSQLLTERPEGFNGRIIHKENRETWMKQIDKHLG